MVVLFVLYLLILANAVKAAESAPLTLETYLNQVKKENRAFQGAMGLVQAAKERREEGSLALAPTFFANAQLYYDAKLPQLPFMSYDQLNLNTYQVGFSKVTSFGMIAKLTYEFDYTAYQNLVLPGGTAAFPLNYYDAAPKLELSQSLWGNGFGRSTRAGLSLSEAQAEANQYQSRFQARSVLAQAESAYWRLVVARESVQIAEDTLDQARKLNEWTKRRSKMNLGENADELQSRANFELRKLEFKSTQDEARAAARAFNMVRNVKSDEVPEELDSLDSETLQAVSTPKRATLRDDVEAVKRQTNAAQAAVTVAEEKTKPTLDIYGSYALNGRENDVGTAFNNSYNANRPTKAVGLKFTLPLDFGTASDTRRGAQKERDAVEMVFRQKVFDQEQSWEDLQHKLDEAKQRLSLSETIENVQQQKLKNERTRLTNGRTTTYQVLLFEGDYTLAALQRLRIQAEILNLVTQMKLYSGEEL
jgi:outer membrane protein TolC